MTTKKIVFIVATVVVALALIAAVFVGGIIGFTLYSVGNSEAAAEAKDFLRTSEKLKNDIGEVRDFGSVITGSAQVIDNNGEATLHLKVIGERKTVNASVDLVYTNGRAWRVSAASYVNSQAKTLTFSTPTIPEFLSPS